MAHRNHSLAADFLTLVSHFFIATTFGVAGIALLHSTSGDQSPVIKLLSVILCFFVAAICLLSATLVFADSRARSIQSKGKATLAWTLWWSAALSLGGIGWGAAMGFAEHEARHMQCSTESAVTDHGAPACNNSPCSAGSSSSLP